MTLEIYWKSINLKTQKFSFRASGTFLNNCKVEFNQPSFWLYSVLNLLVFLQLVTLYLGGIHVKVVSERL